MVKVKKIMIKVPKTEKEKCLIYKGSGGKPLKRKTITYTFKALERFFARSCEAKADQKLRVLVRYPDKSENESLASTDKNYLLYTTACFLEDFLPKKTLGKIENSHFVNHRE